MMRCYDVLVRRDGNAALVARRSGASMLLVEHAPKAFCSGNPRHPGQRTNRRPQ